MGAVNFSIDVSLVEILKRELPLEVFVETGTFRGDGVSKVRGLFQELYTVESSAEYYEGACERFKFDPAIHVFHDTSPTLLRTMMPRLANRSVLYWLDAHSCGEELASDVPQCPLLEELAAIGRLNERSVLLIDDARLFLAPPPPPHNPEHWPSLDLVMQGLHSLNAGHEILVLNDVIVYFPLSIARSIRAFASRCSVDWLTALDKARDYDDVLAKFRQFEQDARQEIQNLVGHAAEKDVQIQRQHADIMRLLQEMSDLRRSSSYRLGFALLNPWTSINQKLLRKS